MTLRLTFLPAWLTNLVATCGLAHSTSAYDGGFGVYEGLDTMQQKHGL